MLLSPPVHPVLKAYYVIKSHIVQEEQTLWLHLLVQRELTFICQTRARSLGHTGAVGWLLLDRELCDTFWHFSLHLHWATSSVTSSKCMQSHLSYGMCSQLATRESRHFCLCLWTGSGSVLDISVTGITEVSGGAVNASRMCRGAQWWFVEEWRFNFHPSLQLLPPSRQSLNGS